MFKPSPRERQTGVRTPLSLWGYFPGRFILVTETLVHKWLPCQAPDVTGSVPDMVSPVSVIIRLGEAASLSSNFYLSVTAGTLQ